MAKVKRTIEELLRMRKLLRATTELIVIDNKTGEILNAENTLDRKIQYLDTGKACKTIAYVK